MDQILIKDLLKAATPEQKLLWNDIFLRFGDTIAVQQYVVRGNIPSEFSNYVLGRMFLGYEVLIGITTGIQAGQPLVSVKDEANNTCMILSNTTSFFNVANQWSVNHISVKNLLFSNLIVSNYQLIHFTGFRIIYQ